MEWILIGLALYFIPTIVALARQKRNAVAIIALNILLGWTLIGWVVALVWAFMHEEPRRRRGGDNGDTTGT